MSKDLKKAYRTVMDDHFPTKMRITFGEGEDQATLKYEKVTWVIGEVEKGLRYGENPGQQAALFKLVHGNLTLGKAELIGPGHGLVTELELLQAGKHPSKINLTDVDNALNILRYLMDRPAVSIMKHNNPSGVATRDTVAEAFREAHLADRIAAFGGAVAINRALDRETAQLISDNYLEVVAAPDFEEGVIEILAQRKNLRIVRVPRIDKLADFANLQFLDLKSLIDGGVIAQTSFVPKARTAEDLLPAQATKKGVEYACKRQPTDEEVADLLFGWAVEAGVTSNSILYVKDNATVGIGTGEQDRVGVARIARDKARAKLADRLAFERHGVAYHDLEAGDDKKAEVDGEVDKRRGGLLGARMVSDAFFPFRDGVDVGIEQGITAVIQPGGSLNDHQSIQACNEADVAMVFTGQRSFKH